MADASNTAVGAVLQQFVNNSWQPLGFYSSKPSDTQQKYRTYDRELLAIYMDIKQVLFISEFTTDVRHVSGVGNAVADALARVDEITCPTTIDFEELSAAQSDDATLAHLLQDTDLPRN
ncbi:Transposon Tf2-11 polyprotein [Eumeta japonica]|uniref:Transposon Tf2-11 polyprotein n=1 Tax=Eumeta variegata TaxID=151549 RepID=A0A4C1UU99_EUMVA|nr:Transposon Tf2-11 polyprotein [Eumeta japonica]